MVKMTTPESGVKITSLGHCGCGAGVRPPGVTSKPAVPPAVTVPALDTSPSPNTVVPNNGKALSPAKSKSPVMLPLDCRPPDDKSLAANSTTPQRPEGAAHTETIYRADGAAVTTVDCATQRKLPQLLTLW